MRTRSGEWSTSPTRQSTRAIGLRVTVARPTRSRSRASTSKEDKRDERREIRSAHRARVPVRNSDPRGVRAVGGHE